MIKMGKRDMIFGGLLFLICLLLLNESRNFYVPPDTVAGPALWPRIVLGLLAVLSLVLMYVGYKHIPKGQKENQEAVSGNQGSLTKKWASLTPGNKRVLAAMLVTMIFLFLFQPLGFIISITAYFLVITYILEPTKNPKQIGFRIVQALALTAFIYMVFSKGLSVRLPAGIIPATWLL